MILKALIMHATAMVELVAAAALGLVLLGALATLIRHRDGRSHVAFTALTLLLVVVQSYLSITA